MLFGICGSQQWKRRGLAWRIHAAYSPLPLYPLTAIVKNRRLTHKSTIVHGLFPQLEKALWFSSVCTHTHTHTQAHSHGHTKCKHSGPCLEPKQITTTTATTVRVPTKSHEIFTDLTPQKSVNKS